MPQLREQDPADRLDSPSISSLLKRLGNETGDLVRAEVALAKLEFRELAGQAARDGVMIGVGLALALVGALALAAWGVLALGELLGGRHGTAALLIGAVCLLAGALLARSAVRRLGQAAAPAETMASLQQNRAWAARELRGLKGQPGADQQSAALGKPAP
jgi:hypothetical protein